MIETQISGKYSPENTPLYDFKGWLTASGISVLFPKGNSVITFSEGFAITHPDEEITPFDITEVAFLRSVRNSPVHIVFNIYKDIEGNLYEGRLGESASI